MSVKAERGATLVWKDLCIYAHSGNRLQPHNFKKIIDNCTGAAVPGSLMAVMGSSGAGKSTLLSALAYRETMDTVVHGDILLNGRPVGPFMHEISGFVHQEDIFMENLTVKEHLAFTAHLRLDRSTSAANRTKCINNLIEKVGLLKCVDVKTRSVPGGEALSGGERKRLAFATELITNPLVLFCDEPTTGLDSFSAQQVIQILHSLAIQGTTVICTIHQPSSQLFAVFDCVLLLAEGKVAFMGSPEQALTFFAQHEYHCPKSYNPADFLIGVLSVESPLQRASRKVAKRLSDEFAVSSIAKERNNIVNTELYRSENNDVFEDNTWSVQKPTWCVALLILCYRKILSANRDLTPPLMRISQKIAIALIAGMCFYGSTTLTQTGVRAIQGAIFILISENTFNPMYSILNYFPQQYPLFIREKKSGYYSTLQYYISQNVAMVPYWIFEPFLFVVSCYWLIGLRTTFYAFALTTVFVTLVLSTASSCGIFFSIVFDNVPLAMAYLVPVDYIFMITSGIFIKVTTMPQILSFLKYFSWMLYANEGLSILQWDQIRNITCMEETENLPCLRTGQDVMDMFNFSLDNLYLDLGAIALLCMTFHILSFIFLWKRS